ncbi:phage holin family protein [Bradyrhizobium sp. 83012]|uniref:Phage holin family protein n=1 Tax=Bradyrhizobium aeschynomenes TaxID=2734909 RepID=A0ABX2CJU2_9BRAD|nr:phage holin family protein [Bradyrhizobium aeschynomenes]
MDTENIAKHLRLLWRTDRVIADIRLRHLLVGLGLRAFAALIAVFGLLMLELAAYLALVQITSAVVAAASLGACNFVIAAILLAVAARAPSGRELELASEIHSSSMDALQLEARSLQSQISSVINHPLNRLIPLLIVPFMTFIIKTLRSHGPTEGDTASSSTSDARAT